MKEFSRTVDLPPVILFREDLYLLEKLLREDFTLHREDDFTITLQAGHQRLTAHSFDELIGVGTPDYTDSLGMRVYSWSREAGIYESLSLTLTHYYSHYQISGLNEAWFLGKIGQLDNFFKLRRPWYAPLNKFVVPLCGVLLGLSPLAFIGVVVSQRYWALVFPLALLLTTAVVTQRVFQRKMFPSSHVDFAQKPKRASLQQQLPTILAVLSLLVSIIGSIVIPLLGR